MKGLISLEALGKMGAAVGRRYHIVLSKLEVESDKPTLEELLLPFTTMIDLTLSG